MVKPIKLISEREVRKGEVSAYGCVFFAVLCDHGDPCAAVFQAARSEASEIVAAHKGAEGFFLWLRSKPGTYRFAGTADEGHHCGIVIEVEGFV